MKTEYPLADNVDRYLTAIVMNVRCLHTLVDIKRIITNQELTRSQIEDRISEALEACNSRLEDIARFAPKALSLRSRKRSESDAKHDPNDLAAQRRQAKSGIEETMDRYAWNDFIDMLTGICHNKAEHVAQQNHRDPAVANWKRVASVFARARKLQPYSD